ncbi:hypothetical protein ACF0H5_011121 [Mactra antiquata]
MPPKQSQRTVTLKQKTAMTSTLEKGSDSEDRTGEVENLRSELKRKEQELVVKQKLIDMKESDLQQLQQKLLSAEKQDTARCARLADLYDELKTAERKALENVLKDKDEEITALNKKLSMSENEVKRLQNDIRKLKNNLAPSASGQKPDKSKYVARQRANALKISISKIKSGRITVNNPDIADLSDLNRPTKLAEKYSELFDNEWAGAYEEMENKLMESGQIVNELLDILKEVYVFSQTNRDECFQEVRDAFSEVIDTVLFEIDSTDSEDSEDDKNNRSSPAKTDLEKQEHILKRQCMNNLGKKQIGVICKVFAPIFAVAISKEYLDHCTNDFDGSPKTKTFIRRCSEIFWWMNAQDPPMILEFDEPKGSFNEDKYRFFTKSGNQIVYIVWPPMRLHQSGPVLAKGVAEAK